jgi:anaerobic selenocysteine-containing dehydrogenase
MWVMCTNPYQSSPKLGRLRKAAEDHKAFIVVSEIYPTKTTELADVVLPSSTWVEKEGMYGNAERRTQHLGKATLPPGEAKDDLCVLAPIEVNGRGNPPKGSVFVPFFDENILINLVCIDAFDPISKEPDFKKCAVKLEKA